MNTSSNGKKQTKQPSKAQVVEENKKLKEGAAKMASELIDLKMQFSKFVSNPHGEVLKHEDGSPMVLRFESNGITVKICEETAVVICKSNVWTSRNTTDSYAILYRMVTLSKLKVYDSDDEDKEGMMTEGQYNDYACGFLLCWVKCLNLIVTNKNNQMDNNLLYSIYDLVQKYYTDLADAADKMKDENPDKIAEIIAAEDDMGSLMTMQKGLKDINAEMEKNGK